MPTRIHNSMNQPTHLSPPELQQKLEAGSVALVDVRLGDDYDAEHLPGAKNNCVFEVAFLDRARQPSASSGRSSIWAPRRSDADAKILR